MAEKTMITIPVDYVAIPMVERDAYIGTISTLGRKVEEVERIKSEIIELCKIEYSPSNTSRYIGSIYISDLIKVLGISEDELKGDKEDGEETV